MVWSLFLLCLVTAVTGGRSQECSDGQVVECMAPMRRYSLDVLSDLFPRYRENALKELCDHYEESEDCFKPLKETCPPLVERQIDAMEDAFDFLCEDGLEDYKKVEECFEASEYIGATDACLGNFFATVNIEAANGEYPTCFDMSALVKCGYEAAKYLCGEEAGYWQCKQSKHALRALFIGNSSCALDCDPGNDPAPTNSTDGEVKEHEPADGETKTEKEKDKEKESEHNKEKKQEHDQENEKDKDDEKSTYTLEDNSSSREEVDTGSTVENGDFKAVHRNEESEEQGNDTGILVGVMGGILIVGMIIVIIGFCRYRAKKRGRLDEQPIVNDARYSASVPSIVPVTGPSSVLFVAPTARGQTRREGAQLVNGQGGAASYGGTVSERVDAQNAHNANVSAYI
ncbi:uncharacterized protein LOC106163919 [Lingula anatina]|uniref:Uncharacterized protein LOC106163919 n=1 Tax=Lingula anatina TaxID=7574 RepID=A0A1S3IGV3_LINAN|nr:uncharacterized protein LOC106163919 [Lingula anatina]|eukprot:XP_013397091.1 uncharacterized protein LOC106163919 [Lingula anatina]